MVSLSFAASPSRPRTVVNGRLVEPMRSFSPQRFATVTLVLAFLYLTNRTARIPSRRKTDFAFWSLSEVSSDRVRLHVAMLSVDCLYRSNSVGPLCTLIRDRLAHHQPLLYDKDDYPYTIHRSICWTLFMSSLFYSCWNSRSKSSRLSRNFLLDAVLDLFLLPIDTALSLISFLAFAIYPTWMRMQTLVLLQHKNSWFHDSLALSVACLMLVALVGNALSRNIWNTTGHNSCQLGRLAPAPAHALVAAATGYYRGSFASDSFLAAPSHNFYGASYYSPTTMNWIFFSLVVASVVPRRRDYGIGIIVSWILTNILAAFFGQYQQEQQVLPVLANTVSNAWKEFWHSLVQN
jgi:hypothetical protein